MSVVSLGLSRRGGGAAGDPPGRGSGVTGGRRSAARASGLHGCRGRNRQGFSEGQAAPRSWSSAGAPGEPRRDAGRRARPSYRRVPSSPGGHPGTARTGLWGLAQPRGPQQLVSLRGAAPPFPGTKAAARAGAPCARAEKGCGARPRERRPGNGAPPEDAPQTSQLSRAGGPGGPGGGGACPAGTRVRGGGARLATGKLTAVV